MRRCLVVIPCTQPILGANKNILQYLYVYVIQCTQPILGANKNILQYLYVYVIPCTQPMYTRNQQEYLDQLQFNVKYSW